MRATADQWTTQRKAHLRALVWRCAQQFRVTCEAVVARVEKDRAREFIVTAFRHGVHERTDKVVVTHVIRRYENLVLFHRFDWDGFGSLPGACREIAEQSTFTHAIEQKVVQANANTASGHAGPDGATRCVGTEEGK